MMSYLHDYRVLLEAFSDNYDPLPESPGWDNHSNAEYLKASGGVATNLASGGTDRIAVCLSTYAATSDISVEADLSTYYLGAASWVLAGIAARIAEPGTDTYYWADIGASGTLLRLYSRVAGTSVQLGSVTVGVTSGLVRLECSGTAIKVYLNGTQRISVTNSAIAGPGRCGLRFNIRTNAAELATADDFALYTSRPAARAHLNGPLAATKTARALAA